MPPKLALFICVIYVFLLLRLERKQTPNVSWVLWIPTAWMLVIAGKPLSIWFGSGDRDEGSPLDQIFLISVFCLGVCILTSRRINLSRTIKENIPLMLLIGYTLLSVFWSEIPFITFKRWTREVIAVVMALLVLSEKEPRQAMLSLLKRNIYILIPFSIILIKYFPEYGIQYRWNGGQMWIGVTLQKNGLGRLCMIAAFFLVWTFVRRWHRKDIPVDKRQKLADLSVLILTLFMLSGPGGQYSATALISFSAGLLIFVGLLWTKKNQIFPGANTLMVFLTVIFSLGTLQPFLGGALIKSASSELGRDDTLTGRTEIWAGLLPDIMQRPFFGYGFASYWTETRRGIHEIGEAHSGYFEVLLDHGLIGLLLILIFLLSSCRKAQRELRHDFDWACLWICFLVMTTIHNYTESSLSSFTTQLPAILLFLAVSSVIPILSVTSNSSTSNYPTKMVTSRSRRLPIKPPRTKIHAMSTTQNSKLCQFIDKKS